MRDSIVGKVRCEEVLPYVWSSSLKYFLENSNPDDTMADILPKAEKEPSHLHIAKDLRVAAQKAAADCIMLAEIEPDLKDIELLGRLNKILLGEHLAAWYLAFKPQRCAPLIEDRGYHLGLSYDRQAAEENIPFLAPGVRYVRILGSPVNETIADCLRKGIAFKCEQCGHCCYFLKRELRNS